jgi:hypothetical protein
MHIEIERPDSQCKKKKKNEAYSKHRHPSTTNNDFFRLRGKSSCAVHVDSLIATRQFKVLLNWGLRVRRWVELSLLLHRTCHVRMIGWCWGSR